VDYNGLITANGDGSIDLWDVAASRTTPLHSFKEHCRKAYSVHWNPVRRDCFMSGSWDGTVKLWNLNSPTSLLTFASHLRCVYAAQW
jgi:peroxin-7